MPKHGIGTSRVWERQGLRHVPVVYDLLPWIGYGSFTRKVSLLESLSIFVQRRTTSSSTSTISSVDLGLPWAGSRACLSTSTVWVRGRVRVPVHYLRGPGGR